MGNAFSSLCTGLGSCCSSICNYFSWPYLCAFSIILIVLLLYFATKAIDIGIVVGIIVAVVALVLMYAYCSSGKANASDPVRYGPRSSSPVSSGSGRAAAADTWPPKEFGTFNNSSGSSQPLLRGENAV